FLWDMHYHPVPNVKADNPIDAVYRNTTPTPTSPWVMPGQYTVVLTVNGRKYSQPITVKMDPRVKTSATDLGVQFELSRQLYDEWLQLQPINDRLASLRTELPNLKAQAKQESTISAIDALGKKLQELAGAANQRPGAPL